MSIYQSNDAGTENGYCHGGDAAEDSSLVIASFPDLDRRNNRKKSRQSASDSQQTVQRLWPALASRWPAMPQKFVWVSVAVAAVLLVGGWLIFSDSESEWTDAEPWRPAPPAASAPEAPRWNSDGQSNSAVASSVSRPSATAIKLDEVSSQGVLSETPAVHVLQKPQRDVPTRKHAQQFTQNSGQSDENQPQPADTQPTQQSPNQRMITTAPAVGDNSADIDVCINKQPSEEPSSRNDRLETARPGTAAYANLGNIHDWQSLSDGEYYWAVRRRSGPPAGQMPAYKTAAKPAAGRRTLKPAATRFIDNAGVQKR